MKKNLIKLQKEFERIKNKGYIKGLSNNHGAIGRTFEQELNLPENEFSIPDYYGIEIKTRRAYSKSYITLFNAVPDGENLFEIERIKETYGYPCKKDKNYKALYAEIYGNKLSFAGIKFQYKIDVDDQNKKVYLCIYNKYNKLIERRVFWSFDYLKNKLLNKLNYLAIVNAWTNNINNWNHFKYYKMNIYKLKNFNAFINLLREGKIKVTLKVDIYTNEKMYGKTYDHGCGFTISEQDITKLFETIDIEEISNT